MASNTRNLPVHTCLLIVCWLCPIVAAPAPPPPVDSLAQMRSADGICIRPTNPGIPVSRMAIGVTATEPHSGGRARASKCPYVMVLSHKGRALTPCFSPCGTALASPGVAPPLYLYPLLVLDPNEFCSVRACQMMRVLADHD